MSLRESVLVSGCVTWRAQDYKPQPEAALQPLPRHGPCRSEQPSSWVPSCYRRVKNKVASESRIWSIRPGRCGMTYMMSTRCLLDSNTMYHHHALVEAQETHKIPRPSLQLSLWQQDPLKLHLPRFTSPFTMVGRSVVRNQAFGLQEQTRTPSFLLPTSAN